MTKHTSKIQRCCSQLSSNELETAGMARVLTVFRDYAAGRIDRPV